MKTVIMNKGQNAFLAFKNLMFRAIFSIAGYEVAGGKYEIPWPAGAWAKSVVAGFTNDYVYGVIIGDVPVTISAIKYSDGSNEATLSYANCLPGHFYAFRGLVQELTTAGGSVTLCLREKLTNEGD